MNRQRRDLRKLYYSMVLTSFFGDDCLDIAPQQQQNEISRPHLRGFAQSSFPWPHATSQLTLPNFNQTFQSSIYISNALPLDDSREFPPGKYVLKLTKIQCNNRAYKYGIHNSTN